MALPSVLAQTDRDFEWIVVNDGGDPATSALLDSLPAGCVRRVDIEHPTEGFAPCIARNIGLQLAQGSVATYLDDDNALEADFIATLRRDFADRPQMQARIPLQRRRRDAILPDGTQRQGKPFLSPVPSDRLDDFVTHKALFDSNGFAHRMPFGPRWNPDWRIYSDYEFLLQCLDAYPEPGAIEISDHIDVLYVQTSAGIIGQSSYADWADELDRLCMAHERYPALSAQIDAVRARAARYRALADRAEAVPAFTQGGDTQ